MQARGDATLCQLARARVVHLTPLVLAGPWSVSPARAYVINIDHMYAFYSILFDLVCEVEEKVGNEGNR